MVVSVPIGDAAPTKSKPPRSVLRRVAVVLLSVVISLLLLDYFNLIDLRGYAPMLGSLLSSFSLPSIASSDVIVGDSPGFLAASKHLQGAMNQSVNPCDDFYEFSCGQWISTHPIPAHLTGYGAAAVVNEKIEKEVKAIFESTEDTTTKSAKMVKSLYRECLDMEKISRTGPKALLESIKSVGTWPMLYSDQWNEKSFDLTELIVRFGKARSFFVVFNFGVGTDFKNTTNTILKFGQAELGLTREFYLNPKKYENQLSAYKTLRIERTKALAEEAGLTVDAAKIEKEVDEVIAFETKFAAIMLSSDEQRVFDKTNNPRPLSYLNNEMPMIDWSRIFHAVMPQSVHAYLDSNPTVIFSDLTYFAKLETLIKSTDARILTNFAFLHYTAYWSMQLGDKFDKISMNFDRVVNGRTEMPPRWQKCVASIGTGTRKTRHAIDSLYVKKHFSKESKTRALSMIEDLQAAMKELLSKSDWMDPETKKAAMKKAAAMSKLIGYNDFIIDDDKLDAYYKELNFDAADSYIDMTGKLSTFEATDEFLKLLAPADNTEIGMQVAVVNAAAIFLTNGIFFPAGILQAPFFDQGFPNYLNYGCMGSVIGHEITHHFDDQGSGFDITGSMRNWWNNETRDAFSKKANCIVEQYGNIEVPGTGLHINGKLTQGENIADNGGVREAYKAYQTYLSKNGAEKRLPSFEQYTNEQMFYIGYSQFWCGHLRDNRKLNLILTDPHSIADYRVNVVLQNQAEFSSAFNCPLGSPMNPEKKCAVW